LPIAEDGLSFAARRIDVRAGDDTFVGQALQVRNNFGGLGDAEKQVGASVATVTKVNSRQKIELSLLAGAVVVSRFVFRSHFLYDLDSVNFALGMGDLTRVFISRIRRAIFFMSAWGGF
jgi:hypothetical protein